jgi:hypothetical protein
MTEDFSINPYVGIGGLRFGMTRDAIRKEVGSAFEVFRRGPEDALDSDVFDGDGIYVYYDSNDLCEAIEFAGPASPTLFSSRLIGQPLDRVLTYLKKYDSTVSVDESGATAYAIGVGVYAPAAKKKRGCLVESVIVFRRNYYY